jgi:alpha-glucosidase
VAAQEGVTGSVMEFYRAMLAFRKASALCRRGTRFLDVAEPVLAFVRGDALLCLFNLSDTAVTLAVEGVGAIVGPSQAAKVTDGAVTLGPLGFVLLDVTGDVRVTL